MPFALPLASCKRLLAESNDIITIKELLALIHGCQHENLGDFREPLKLDFDTGGRPLLAKYRGKLFIVGFSRLILRSDQITDEYTEIKSFDLLGCGSPVSSHLGVLVEPIQSCYRNVAAPRVKDDTVLPWGINHVLSHIGDSAAHTVMKEVHADLRAHSPMHDSRRAVGGELDLLTLLAYLFGGGGEDQRGDEIE